MLKLLKLAIIATIITSSTILYGCVDSGENYNEFQDIIKTKVTIRGELKSLANASADGGNFLLDADDDKVYTLIELKDGVLNKVLVGQTVEVMGFFREKNGEKTHTIEVDSISRVQEKAEDNSLKSVWKEYENSYNGISFKRMSNWIPEQEGEKVTFYFPLNNLEENEVDDMEKREKIVVERINNDKELTLEKWLDENHDTHLGFVKNSVGDDKLNAFKKESDEGKEILFVIERKPNVIYQFQHVTFGDADYFERRNQFFDLLFSVKFIDFDEEARNVSPEPTPTETTTSEPSPTPKPISTPEPTATPEPTPEATPLPTSTPKATTKPSTETSDKQEIINYIKKYINNITPDQSKVGTWTAKVVQFVEPDYAYIEYTDGIEKRKILVKYDFGVAKEFKVIGSFNEGDDRDWAIVEGTNPVAKEERATYEIDTSGAVNESLVIKAGFRYFESKPFNFKIQYPSSWYYAGYGSQNDHSAIYKFSTKPLDQVSEALITLYIHKNEIGKFSVSRVGDDVFAGKYNGDLAYFVKRENGGTFVLVATDITQSDIVKQMIDTLIQ
ncbi:hypothetical protein KKG71_05380 [Patescibacteria group bacterium]|nr:hypothetical protein [Patescibacteria group bacterium]